MTTVDPMAMLAKTRRMSATIWLIAAVIAIFLIWASVAWVDQIVRGPGEIVSSSKPQIIQNLEGGILAELDVAEGDQVTPGTRSGQALWHEISDRGRRSARPDRGSRDPAIAA